jgi:TolB-like protein/Tfp pilus assembly protein PilF
LGDAVNVASRIQSLGQANTILFSKEICDKIRNQSEFKTVSLGMFEFKNVYDPVEILALANEGLVVPKKEQMEGKLKKKNTPGRKRTIAAIFMIILVACALFYYFFTNKNRLFGQEKSIAVLPFDVSGNNEDNLASGFVDDIVVRLANIKEFEKVISDKSSSRFTNSKLPLKEIGEELGAVYLVTGSIQQSGNKIHVNAQLINSENGTTIWGGEYSGENIEIFELQRKLATEIVSALKTKITPLEKIGLNKQYTDNVEAYKLYRKGRMFWDQRSKASYDSAETYYKKAIELDPDYALAYCGLADCYIFNQKGLLQPEAIPIARSYAEKALLLDSTLVEARTTVAFIQSHYDFDWKGSIVLFKKIIIDNPNYAFAHLYYGNVLLSIGKFDEAFYETRKALSLDPLSGAINYVLGRDYYLIRKYDSSISQLQENLTLNPKFINSNVPLGESFVQKKLYAKAIEAFSKCPKKPWDLGSDGLLFLAYTYACAGDTSTARAQFEMVTNEDRLRCPYYMAYFYISMGDSKEALTQLEYGYQIHAIHMPFLKIDPFLDPLRNEQRFKALIKKMNFD